MTLVDVFPTKFQRRDMYNCPVTGLLRSHLLTALPLALKIKSSTLCWEFKLISEP